MAASAPSPAPAGRLYRGMTAADRHADRRRRLLEAGLDLFGTKGYAATTIEEICQRAGVTARNFYDHFRSREDLLLAVYDAIVELNMGGILGTLAADPPDLETGVRAGIEAAIRPWVEDERKGRVARVEVVGVSPRVEEHRLAVLEGYAGLVDGYLRHLMDLGLAPRRELSITPLALVGGVNEVMVNWLHRAERPPIESVIDELVALYVAVVRGAAA